MSLKTISHTDTAALYDCIRTMFRLKEDIKRYEQEERKIIANESKAKQEYGEARDKLRKILGDTGLINNGDLPDGWMETFESFCTMLYSQAQEAERRVERETR